MQILFLILKMNAFSSTTGYKYIKPLVLGTITTKTYLQQTFLGLVFTNVVQLIMFL